MDSNEIAAYYDETCRNSQYGWQASLLFSEDDQYVRFATVNSIIAPNSSVLDVGCGQGDFCPFAVPKNLLYDKTYEGYKCWEGYFESFESCEVQSMVVE